MKNKRAFTLVELIAVIMILAIIILIVAPNVINLSGNTKVSLHDSKIKTLESAGEKYGNVFINDYKDCQNESGSSYLNDKCTVPIRDLITNGYLTADDDLDNIINPETNEPFDGSVLLCYNPKEVNIYASYLQKSDTPQCKDINVETGASLALSSSTGVGYNGGDPIEVRILKTGKVTTECKSSDSSLVSCKIEGSILKITSNKAESFTEGSRLVKIDVIGKHDSVELKQTYSLTMYPTSLSIDTSSQEQSCMEVGTALEYPIQGTNMGTIDISSEKDILLGSIKEGKTLVLNANQKAGIDTITLKEKNGNAEASITKNVFKLQVDREMPTEMLLGNKEKFTLDYDGNEKAKISVVPLGDTKPIKIFMSDENKLVDELELSGDKKTFHLKAVDTGRVKVIIEGSNCGRREYEIQVSNLYLEKKEAILYLGGSSFETTVVGGNDIFTCTTTNQTAVSCEIKGSTLKLTPGTTESENVTVRVAGSNGGYDTVDVKVRSTSLSLVDEAGRPITKVCSNVETSTIQDIVINARHAGAITVDRIADELLATATIANNKIVPANISLGSQTNFASPYKQGYNTGITNIRIKESNGNKTAAFDYYIYKMAMSSNTLNYEITNNTTEEFNVVTSSTGEISAVSSHPEIASVSVVNPTYAYGVNKENVSKLRITGHSIGETNIVIRGANCGEMIITVKIVGQKFSITLKQGMYTSNIEGVADGEDSRELSCTTENSNNSCQVSLPNFTMGKNADEKIGYVEREDPTKITSSDTVYSVGDTLTLSTSTNGKILYAQSGDTTAPVCIFLENMSTVSYGKVEYFTLSCNEPGSGSDSVLTKDSFVISNPSVAEIVSVGDRTEIVDESFGRAGYTYRIGIRGKSLVGEFDLSLKKNSVVDKFGNGNEELKKDNIFAAEYKGYKRWYVGKENDTDVVAILYVNADMPEEIKESDPDDTYTLILYGAGDTKSYEDTAVTTEIPWIREGYQEYITNVIVRGNITSIGDNLFQSLYNMTRVTLPDSIKSLGKNSFNNDQSLKEIKMPASLESIMDSAFENCRRLEKVELNQGLQNIGNAAFLNHGIRELFIPKTVQLIGTNSFKSDVDNMKLENLTFEQGITIKTIGKSAFQYHQLKSLTIPRSVVAIAEDAFAQNDPMDTTLTDLNFENDSELKYIYDRAFDLCNLSHLELPDTVEEIGTSAFTYLGDTLKKIHLGPKVKNIGNCFAIGINIEEFEVDPANPYLTTHEGVLYTKDMSKLIRFPESHYKKHSSYTVPEGVSMLQGRSFGGLLYYHEKTEFSINLPSTLTEANSIYNFLGTIFSEINVNSSNANYTSIDGVMFDKSLKKALVLPTHYPQENYHIPSGTEIIDTYFAYTNQSVKNITIPSSVKKIDNFAFYADPNLAFGNIYLETDDSVELGNGAFTIGAMISSPTYHRTIHVKSDSLKAAIEGLYALEDISVERW